VREVLETAVVSLLILTLLGGVLGIGSWYSASACRTGHPERQVQWSLTGGCQVMVGTTLLPGGMDHT
jgi:hypothetical protein